MEDKYIKNFIALQGLEKKEKEKNDPFSAHCNDGAFYSAEHVLKNFSSGFTPLTRNDEDDMSHLYYQPTSEMFEESRPFFPMHRSKISFN